MPRTKKTPVDFHASQKKVDELESLIEAQESKIRLLQSRVEDQAYTATRDNERIKQEVAKLQLAYAEGNKLRAEITTLSRAIHILTKPQ